MGQTLERVRVGDAEDTGQDLDVAARPEAYCVSGLHVRLIALYLRSRELDPEQALTEHGIALKSLDDVDFTVGANACHSLWRTAALLTADPLIGLHAGELAALGTYDVVDYAVMSAGTVREGLERMTRYYPVICSQGSMLFEVNGAQACFSHRLEEPWVREDWRHGVEAFFAMFVQRMRNFGHFGPTVVRFAHGRLGPASEYARAFACPVEFGADFSHIVFEAADLERVPTSADPNLGRLVSRYVEELRRNVPGPNDLVHRTRQAIASGLASSPPTLDQLAKQLAVSTRTLQRRLHEVGISFNDLLDEVRREAAQRLLRDRSISVGEVSFLLGFSQAPSFHRAFRRWTGTTPAEYRAQACASNPPLAPDKAAGA